MDLWEAESVIDLIDAQSAAAAKNAAARLDGGLRRRLEPVQEALIESLRVFGRGRCTPTRTLRNFSPQQIDPLCKSPPTPSACCDTAQRGQGVKNGVRTANRGLPIAEVFSAQCLGWL